MDPVAENLEAVVKHLPCRTRLAPIIVLLALVCLLPAARAGAAPLGALPGASPASPAAPADGPVRFEKNWGQSDPRVEYLARGAGYWLFLTPRAAVVALQAGEPQPQGAPPREIATTVLRMEGWGPGRRRRRSVSASSPAGATS